MHSNVHSNYNVNSTVTSKLWIHIENPQCNALRLDKDMQSCERVVCIRANIVK